MSAVFKRAMQGYNFYKQCCCKYDFKGAASVEITIVKILDCLQVQEEMCGCWKWSVVIFEDLMKSTEPLNCQQIHKKQKTNKQ